VTSGTQKVGSKFYTLEPDATKAGYKVLCKYSYSDYGCKTFEKYSKTVEKPDTCAFHGLKYSYTAGSKLIQTTLSDSVVTYTEYTTRSACEDKDFTYAVVDKAATVSCFATDSSNSVKVSCDNNNVINYITYTGTSCGSSGDSSVVPTMDCDLVAGDLYITSKCVPAPAPGPAPAPTGSSSNAQSSSSTGGVVGGVCGGLAVLGGVGYYYFYVHAAKKTALSAAETVG
jgi:hypothetical protein